MGELITLIVFSSALFRSFIHPSNMKKDRQKK